MKFPTGCTVLGKRSLNRVVKLILTKVATEEAVALEVVQWQWQTGVFGVFLPPNLFTYKKSIRHAAEKLFEQNQFLPQHVHVCAKIQQFALRTATACSSD